MNTAALLAPLSESLPCGPDLSFSPEFDAIAEDRRADDPTLDQGEWKTRVKTADWPRVQARCTALLTSQTKDLRLLGWLTEAATHQQGFAGMADGLQACAQACRTFWPDLHPLPEDGDMEQRIGNLTWLLVQVASLSRTLPLVDAGPGRRYSLPEVEAARQRTGEDDAGAAGQVPGPDGLNAEALARAQKDTPPDFFRHNLAGAERALDALLALQEVVDALLGEDGPGFVAAKAALADVIHAARRLARDMGVAGDGDSDSDALLPPDGQGSPDPLRASESGRPVQAPANPQGPTHIQDREQALAQLRRVADYFRRTEPHSPVAYLADKAVQWGNMPLHVWLRAVLKNGEGLAHVEELLGVAPTASPTEGG